MEEELMPLWKLLESKQMTDLDFGSFKKEYSSPEMQKELYDGLIQARLLKKEEAGFTDFQTQFFPLKKKVSTKPSSKDSAFNWETGQVDVKKLSSTPPAAPTAESGLGSAQLDSLRKTVAEQQYIEQDKDLTSQEYQAQTKEEQALRNIRERRGTDFSSSAADIAKGRIDIAAKRTSTPLEMLHSAASQLSFSDWLNESPEGQTAPLRPDQRTAAEFNAFSSALADENREIGLAIKGLESKMKQEYGVDMKDYDSTVAEFNALQVNAKKLTDDFNKLPDNKKTQEEADRVNSMIEQLTAQSEQITAKLEEFQSMPEFEEMSKLYELSNINTKKYEDELKTGKYDHAKKFGEFLKYRQDLKDEAYKKMSGFEKVASSTGTVILHTLAKAPQSVASLTDVIEKSFGMEGEKVGAGDLLQDLMIGMGDDIQAAFPAPSKLQRGGFTDTAKWGDYQVDFTSDGEIQTIRDKDGYIMGGMLSEQQQDEIKSLKRERQFNAQSFAYQAGSTIADVGLQILGTKGLSGIKALPGVVGTSWGLPKFGMKTLGTEFGMIATTAGMMSNDLYKEGLENGLSEEDAARYSLSAGVVIGLVNTLAGVGIEEQLLMKSRIPSIGLRNKMPGFVGRKAYDVITGGTGELIEEVVLEKLAQTGVQYAMNEMAGGKFDIDPYKDTTSIINEATTAFVAGGIFGFAKGGGKPNAMQRSMLADGAKNIPKTIEAVKEVAVAAGTPLTHAEEATLKEELEVTKAAIEKIPAEQKTNPDVVETMVEKTKIDEQIAAKKEEIKSVDPAFQQDAKNEIAALEVKSAELALQVAEKAGVTPDEKAVKLLEPKEGEVKAEVKKGDDLSIEDAKSIIAESDRLWEEVRNKELETISDRFISGEINNKQYIDEVKELDKRFAEAHPDYYRYDNGIKPSGKMQNAINNFYEKGSEKLLENVGAKLEEIFGANVKNGKIEEAQAPAVEGPMEVQTIEEPPTEPTAETPVQEAAPPPPPVDEGDVNSPILGQRLRGFYANSLKKMEGVTPGQGILAKIAQSDPQFYAPMTRAGNSQLVADEIDNDGLDVVVQRAMADNTGEPEGVVAARRVISLIALGDAMVEANRAGDTQALDQMRNSARELERLLGKKGTEFGQALSMYAIYSQTPEGQLVARLRDVEEKRQRIRTRMTEGGRPVGDVVDSIVEDVAKEAGITRVEAEEMLAKVYGKKKAMSAAKETIAKGKKEVQEARAAIRNIMLGRANVGLPVAQYAKAGKEFIKLFSGYAKIYKGNLQKIRASFRKDVNEAGLNGTAAYEWLEANHPEITGPIAEFHDKMLNAIVGFYNGDIKGDLKSALEKIGLTEQEAIAISDDFAAGWGAELAKKKESRLKQIVRTHVKSKKKARIIENGLLEAITLGGLDNDTIRKKLEEKYGIKSFTNEQIAELNQMVLDMKDMPSRGQKFKQMREMMDYIHLHGGIDITSFLAATWYAKVLFSVKTALSVSLGNEVNFWDNFVVHGLATEGGLYAMQESVKRLVKPIASKLGLMEGSYQDRGLWFGLAEGLRFIKTGEASREMKKVARSADLELVARMSFVEAARDAMTSFANVSKAFENVADADGFKDKMQAAMGIVSQLGTSAYLSAKAFAIPHSRIFKYSLRVISAADSLRYYSMLDFTLDRMAYNSAIAEGLTGDAAKQRAKELVGDTMQASKELIDQATAEFTQYAADRGQSLKDMFTDVDIAYRAREIAEERLDEAWRKSMERDAELQGQFDEAVLKVMEANPGMERPRAEKVARRIRTRYYDNQVVPTEKARADAEKVALQNDPQGVMGKVAKLLSADFPAMFDDTINEPDPEPTGDEKVDSFNEARAKVKKSLAKVAKTYSSFVFPFMKTMANVVNMKIERFPVLGGVMKGIDSMVGAPSIDWKNSEQRRIFFARQIAGNIILFSVLMWIKQREDDDEPAITLTGPKDLGVRQSEIETKAWKKETITVGGKRFYFGDTPYAAVLGYLGVREDAIRYAKEGEEDWTTGTMTMALLTQMFTNASYMQTFSNLSTAMQEQDAAKFGAALASPVSGMASSGIQRDLDRWFSPEIRDRKTVENRFVGEMLARTPFAANNLLDFKYNSIGETINPYENESMLTQAIGLDKYISSTEVSNPIFEVLADKNVRFGGIGKSIDILGTEATYQEKRDYTLFVGRYRRKVLSENLDSMRQMTTEQLELQLDKTDSEAKRAAELFILLQRKDKANPELGQSKDVSVETIDAFIREYDIDMVKDDSEMYLEELRTEKPEIEIDESLFF